MALECGHKITCSLTNAKQRNKTFKGDMSRNAVIRNNSKA